MLSPAACNPAPSDFPPAYHEEAPESSAAQSQLLASIRWRDPDPDSSRGSTLTNLTFEEPYIDPYERRQQETFQAHKQAISDAKERLDALKREAKIEGLFISSDSEEDLLYFLSNIYIFRNRPIITLLDNGNFRAHWKNKDKESVGIQFRGEKQVHYVFFACRAGGMMARCYGSDALSEIRRLIEANNLRHLVTA